MKEVAEALERAGKRLNDLLDDRNVELMRPSDILVSIANVFHGAGKEIAKASGEIDLDG